MKTTLFDIKGKEKGKIDLPKIFSSEIREDIVAKVLETKKVKQPYSPSPVAGKQYSAMGKMRHRRHVWQTSYGRGMSRVPRKVMSNRGTQFNWVGAEAAGTRGGRRAHPPKIIGMINTKKINKKEMMIALRSALSATTSEKFVKKKYETLGKEKIQNLPWIIEDKITSLKTKEMLICLNSILGETLYNVAIRKKRVRAGKGKMRGRKYKGNAGLLLVLGNKEEMKTNIIEYVKVDKLGVNDLARGGLGRLTIYTEAAIKEIGEKHGK
ncbi:MAG TPA: 50S ribosomal protein L4 [Candidatus Nanoarchaeia archaeon]|nr:50S ribosomal protein L4 [Candidatus Nanoarchaeia archaeon]